jgi:hypothetical protein
MSRIMMELQFHPNPAARKLSTNLYDIYTIAECTVNNS